MTAKDAWATISTAFNDLESLAESVEDERLDNYPNLQQAFDTVTEVIEIAASIVHSENNLRGGNSAYEQVQDIERLAELTGVELVPLNES